MSGIHEDFSIYRVNAAPNVLDDDDQNRRQGKGDADSQAFKKSKDDDKRKMVASGALLLIKKMMKKTVESKDTKLNEKLKKHQKYETNKSSTFEKAKSILKNE